MRVLASHVKVMSMFFKWTGYPNLEEEDVSVLCNIWNISMYTWTNGAQFDVSSITADLPIILEHDFRYVRKNTLLSSSDRGMWLYD